MWCGHEPIGIGDGQPDPLAAGIDPENPPWTHTPRLYVGIVPPMPPSSPDPASPAPGDPAPGLALPTIDGEPFDLAHRDHKIALVTFLRHAG